MNEFLLPTDTIYLRVSLTHNHPPSTPPICPPPPQPKTYQPKESGKNNNFYYRMVDGRTVYIIIQQLKCYLASSWR